MGKLNLYKATLHVIVEVPPVVQRQRRIVHAYKQAVDKKLEELLSTDVIEETDGPTSGVSPVVIAPKKNVDIRCVTEAIISERHPLPTMDEILNEANGRAVGSITPRFNTSSQPIQQTLDTSLPNSKLSLSSRP